MRLFQYWDSGQPPAEVVALADTIRAASTGFDYRCYDEVTAADFIERRYGSRERSAFAACAVPAMQSDYARLCLLDVHGGLYVDSDQRADAPLGDMIEQVGSLLLPSWATIVNNAVIFARAPANPIIRACLRLATDNILERRFEDVLLATGPGVFNAVRYVIDPEARDTLTYLTAIGGWWDKGWEALLAHTNATLAPDGSPPSDLVGAWKAATIMPRLEMKAWLLDVQPEYKQGCRHWKKWPGSIYR